MKKIKIEIPLETYSGIKTKIFIHAEAEDNIKEIDDVKTIFNPTISVIDTHETAAEQDAKK